MGSLFFLFASCGQLVRRSKFELRATAQRAVRAHEDTVRVIG